MPLAQGIAARDTWRTLDGCGESSEAYGSLGCVRYEGCADGADVVWCEDSQKTAYKHDLDAAYRTPIWEWFDSFE